MIAAIIGALAVLFCAGLGITWVLIETAEPAGHHHKPPGPTWRQRYQDRRLRERAGDEAWLRDVQEVGAEMRMEGTTSGAETYTPAPGMQVPLQVPPLMPLPPEVAHPFPSGIRHYDGPDLTPGQVTEFRERFAAAMAAPADPLAVLGDDAQADAYVGPVTGHTGTTPETCRECGPDAYVGAADPEMDYRDETGTWPALVDAVMPKDGPEIIPVRPH